MHLAPVSEPIAEGPIEGFGVRPPVRALGVQRRLEVGREALARRRARSRAAHEGDDALELVAIEPDAVPAAVVDHHPAWALAVAEGAAVHELAAGEARD